MGQRNLLYGGPMIETEQGHLQPEPCIVPYGGIPNFPQPTNSHMILPPPTTRTIFNPQHLPENHGPLPHGIAQYNGLDRHPSNNLFMTPSPNTRVYPVTFNHEMQNQLPFSNICGGFENGQFLDGYKRKNNIQYFYPAPGSSSSVAIDGTMMDGPPLVMDPAAAHISLRNRGSSAIGVEPVLAHSNSQLMPGNYDGQPFQAASNPWLDHRFCGNGGDTAAFSWNHGPGLPHIQGPSGVDVGLHGYQVHPPDITPYQGGPHNLHHPPPPPMPPMHGHNMDFHSQLLSTSRRPSTNTYQNGIELGPRFVGPVPPTGLRVLRPHRRDVIVDATSRHRSFSHLRILPEDEVAILDISGYHEVGHSVDHHRDMRLDIDHMSYEELLALGEQIGSVGSGLSSDFVLEHLKTRVFAISKSSHAPEDASSADQETNSCVICQTNYDDEEQIGVLDCGHEYHVECIKKWLIVKNTCPICKSTGLAAAQANEL
ncbi:probable E3 ubiquitin-protein ligase ZFP1 [Rutidosis leptorrhynchoides]|uniref:probable E3 ubiquitin-protein ligase ZFP1 n=1 Tax=Rutidosis leptorrhynchoides TaxID=125765 RepID=UPI003A998DD7